MRIVYVNVAPVPGEPGDEMSIFEFVDAVCTKEPTDGFFDNFFVVGGTPQQLQTVADAIAQSGVSPLVVWAPADLHVRAVQALIEQGKLQAYGVVPYPASRAALHGAVAITLARVQKPEARAGQPPEKASSGSAGVPEASPVPLPEEEKGMETEDTAGAPDVPEQPPQEMPPSPRLLPEISPEAPPPAPEVVPAGPIRVVRPPRAVVREARVQGGVITLLIHPPGVHTVDVFVSSPDAQFPPHAPTLTLTGTAEVQFGVPGEPGTLVKLWIGVDGEPPLPLEEPVRVPRPPAAVRAKPGKIEVFPRKPLANSPITVAWSISVSAPTVATGYLSIGGGTYPATATLTPPGGRLEWVLASGLPVGKHTGEVALATPVSAKAKLVIETIGLAGASELRQQPYGVIAVTGDAILHAIRALRPRGVKSGVRNCTEWDIPEEPPLHPSEGLVLVAAHPNTPPDPPPTLATVYVTIYQPPQREVLEMVMGWGAPVVLTTPSGKPWGVESEGVRVVQFDPAKPRPLLADVLR